MLRHDRAGLSRGRCRRHLRSADCGAGLRQICHGQFDGDVDGLGCGLDACGLGGAGDGGEGSCLLLLAADGASSQSDNDLLGDGEQLGQECGKIAFQHGQESGDEGFAGLGDPGNEVDEFLMHVGIGLGLGLGY